MARRRSRRRARPADRRWRWDESEPQVTWLLREESVKGTAVQGESHLWGAAPSSNIERQHCILVFPRSQTLFGNAAVFETPFPRGGAWHRPRRSKRSFRDRSIPKQSLGTRGETPNVERRSQRCRNLALPARESFRSRGSRAPTSLSPRLLGNRSESGKSAFNVGFLYKTSRRRPGTRGGSKSSLETIRPSPGVFYGWRR